MVGLPLTRDIIVGSLTAFVLLAFLERATQLATALMLRWACLAGLLVTNDEPCRKLPRSGVGT